MRDAFEELTPLGRLNLLRGNPKILWCGAEESDPERPKQHLHDLHF